MHPFYGPNAILLSEGSSGWIGLASMAIYLLFWAVVILFAYRAFKKYIQGKFSSENPHDNSLKILNERYARGEIGREEFLEKKSDLKS